MQITLIGIVVIILSIIAFFKNEDWLLKLVIISSIFTAAIAADTFMVILPFEIPLVLWILKQIINFIKSKTKISKENIINLLKKNKIFTAILIFIIILVISELWLIISNLHYEYYDTLYKEDSVITFKSINFTQCVRLIAYLIFAMLLSLKINNKEKIQELIKVFGRASFCAVVWGLIQFIIYYLGIEYPAFLFNNNPYAAQGYDQMMFGIKRISSIGTEPSAFALNLLVFLPIIISYALQDNKTQNKYRKILLDIAVVMTIICTILTTSTTALVGLVIIMLSLLICLIIRYKKENNSRTYKKRIIKVIQYSVLSIIIAIILCFCGNEVYENKKLVQFTTSEKNEYIQNTNILNIDAIPQDKSIQNVDITTKSENTQTLVEVNENRKMKSESFMHALKGMTLDKLSSGSGQERMEREKLGLNMYLLSPVFGVGWISFRTFTLFTNVLVNVGIIGLTSIIYIFAVVIKQIIKNRRKDLNIAMMFGLTILGMLVAFAISIPDLHYIYCWLILVLAYNYFKDEDKQEKMKKENLIIGIDGRSLDLKNRTGITTYMYEVIKKLNDLDSKNTYYIYSNKDVNFDFKLNSNFEVRRYNSKKGTLGYYFKLPKILKKDNVDILWGTQHVLPMRNIYTKNIKFILTVHDLAIHKLKTVGQFKNTIIQRLFLKKSCRNADVIMADSKATKDDIVEIFGIDEQKIKVVYLGTNFSNEYNVSNKEEKGILKKFNIENKNYLFFVSTIEPRKNIITLIKAYEVLKRKEENKTLKLILAGGLGWKYQDVLDAIEKSEFKEYINLAGYISKDEKECLLKNAKCFVYPSLYEGFGLPILEAMAKEAIVVTSNISSIPEVGGKAAFYLNNVHDENELASLIEKVLKLDEETKKEIIEKGHNQVKKFTWEKCANEIVYLLTNKKK